MVEPQRRQLVQAPALLWSSSARISRPAASPAPGSPPAAPGAPRCSRPAPPPRRPPPARPRARPSAPPAARDAAPARRPARAPLARPRGRRRASRHRLGQPEAGALAGRAGLGEGGERRVLGALPHLHHPVESRPRVRHAPLQAPTRRAPVRRGRPGGMRAAGHRGARPARPGGRPTRRRARGGEGRPRRRGPAAPPAPRQRPGAPRRRATARRHWRCHPVDAGPVLAGGPRRLHGRRHLREHVRGGGADTGARRHRRQPGQLPDPWVQGVPPRVPGLPGGQRRRRQTYPAAVGTPIDARPGPSIRSGEPLDVLPEVGALPGGEDPRRRGLHPRRPPLGGRGGPAGAGRPPRADRAGQPLRVPPGSTTTVDTRGTVTAGDVTVGELGLHHLEGTLDRRGRPSTRRARAAGDPGDRRERAGGRGGAGELHRARRHGPAHQRPAPLRGLHAGPADRPTAAWTSAATRWAGSGETPPPLPGPLPLRGEGRREAPLLLHGR